MESAHWKTRARFVLAVLCIMASEVPCCASDLLLPTIPHARDSLLLPTLTHAHDSLIPAADAGCVLSDPNPEMEEAENAVARGASGHKGAAKPTLTRALTS